MELVHQVPAGGVLPAQCSQTFSASSGNGLHTVNPQQEVCKRQPAKKWSADEVERLKKVRVAVLHEFTTFGIFPASPFLLHPYRLLESSVLKTGNLYPHLCKHGQKRNVGRNGWLLHAQEFEKVDGMRKRIWFWKTLRSKTRNQILFSSRSIPWRGAVQNRCVVSHGIGVQSPAITLLFQQSAWSCGL